MRYVFLAIALATPGLSARPLMAQQSAAATAEQTVLERRSAEVVAVLNAARAPETIFSQSFLRAISVEQLTSLSASIVAQFGAAQEVALLSPRDGTRAVLHIRFERGLAKGSIAIDPSEDHRVSELVFTSIDAFEVADDSPAKIAADLAALPGRVNAWFAPVDGGAPVIAMGTETPLALGSTFSSMSSRRWRRM